ncbi:MAG: sensor domain-containing diguanylate cyclase [Anaerolineae bacterium]|nr:sensor domain-containing diguanylate cyclase [Anaerolineae bacterium]MDH7475095.1 sensor domain-containing diguanylate cyclase [Anaerolineae bacterium]
MAKITTSALQTIAFWHELHLAHWAIIGLAALFLLTSPDPATQMMGWAAWGVAVLFTITTSYFSGRHRELPDWFRCATTVLDCVLITAIILGLRGPITTYVILYLLAIAGAALCFGPWKTILVAATAGVLTSGLVIFWFKDFDVIGQIIPAWGLIISTAALSLALKGRVLEHIQDSQEHAENLERKLTELAVLQELERAVYDLQSGNTLQNIAEVPTKVLGFRRAALLLTTDGKTGDLPYESYHSYRDTFSPLPPLHFDRDLFAAIIEKNRPFIVDGSQGSPLMAQGPMLQIAAPLKGEQRPVGVLVVDCDDRARIEPNDLEVLSNLAKSAVLAIENAQLHNQVQRMANLDGLTNVYNHRYFQDSLRQTLREAQATRQPVSLVMIEVDKFKNFNDSYGHSKGDQVLKSIARSLEVATQEWKGLVARYGGDEFMVILPGVNATQSIQIANDLLIWVTDMVTLDLQENHGLPGVRFSLGVATYPDDAQDPSSLIDAADDAMYMAKHYGGNQVRTFRETDPTLRQERAKLRGQ